MDVQSVGDKCGLKAVRHELEKRGTILRFCDACYWGELDADAGLAGSEVERKQADSPSNGR